MKYSNQMSLYDKLIYTISIFLSYGNLKIRGPLFVSAGRFRHPAIPPINPAIHSDPTKKIIELDISKNSGEGVICYNQGYKQTFVNRQYYSFNVVKKRREIIWKADKEEEYSKKVLVDDGKNILIIHYGRDGHSTKVFNKGPDGKWTEVTQASTEKTATDAARSATTTPLTASSTPPKVKLFKANPSDPSNPLELDTNDITVTKRGNLSSYQIAEGVNCVYLIFDDVLLWVYDSTKYGGIYPKSVYHYTSTDVVVLKFEGLDMTFYKNDQAGWMFDESGSLQIKFHVVDPNDSTKNVELSSTQFRVTESVDATRFTIATGVNCAALTYGPVLLWQYDPNQRGSKYPKSLAYFKSSDTLVLKFEGLDIAFSKNAQGAWEYREIITSRAGTAGTPASFEGMSSGDAGIESVTEEPLELSDPRCLDLDINITHCSFPYEVSYIAHGDPSDFVCNPKGEYRFKSVKDKSCLIWKADKVSDCATKVRVYKSISIPKTNITIFSPSGEKTFIKKNPNKVWQSLSSSYWEETTQTIVHN